MKTGYDRLFEYLERKDAPVGLLDKIYLSISKETVGRALWVRTVISGVLSLIALIAFVPSWAITQSEIYQSGFSQFFSLLLSDTNTVFMFWKEFSLSLLESFPILGSLAVLASIFVFLISIRFFTRDILRIIHQPKLNRA